MQKIVGHVINALIEHKAHHATKYLSPTKVVRATRYLSGGRIPRPHHIDIRLKIGQPNVAESHFIKLCKKAGEKFPVRKIQLKFPAAKK